MYTDSKGRYFDSKGIPHVTERGAMEADEEYLREEEEHRERSLGAIKWQASDQNGKIDDLAALIQHLEWETTRIGESLIARLDFMIDTLQNAGQPPPPAFYNALRDWMQSHPTPRHVAITLQSLRQGPTVCRLLQQACSAFATTQCIKSDLAHVGDFAGLLTNLDGGDVLIVPLPEFMRPSFNEVLTEACLTGKLMITIDQGTNARTVRLNLPDFRAVFVTMRRERLPEGVGVVWPPEEYLTFPAVE